MHTRDRLRRIKNNLAPKSVPPASQLFQWQRGFPMLQGAGACKEFTFRTECKSLVIVGGEAEERQGGGGGGGSESRLLMPWGLRRSHGHDCPL
jgi:hypothetical protein